jgi:DNA-binding transcriptional regulator YbjK
MKRIAICVFDAAFDDDPKEYYYFTDIDDLERNDYAVADSGPGLGIVKIRSFTSDASNARRWLVQKIDMKAHKERIKRQERIDTLKAQLESRRKKFEEEHLWSIMAEKDPKAAAFLAEIKKLEE